MPDMSDDEADTTAWEINTVAANQDTLPGPPVFQFTPSSPPLDGSVAMQRPASVSPPPSRSRSTSDHLHLPMARDMYGTRKPSPTSTHANLDYGVTGPTGEQVDQAGHERTLAALAIGAPLLASVVVSCLSVVQAELASAFPDAPSTRPPGVQAAVALMWSAVATTLGSALIAVAGLAIAAGYHDSHVGVTKTIVRRIRAWKRARRNQSGVQRGLDGKDHVAAGAALESSVHPHTSSFPPSVVHSIGTVEKRNQHGQAALRAAEVSARLLGVSIVFLSASLAVFLFEVYPRAVAIPVLIVGVLTALACATPLLPIVFPSSSNHGE